VALGVACVATPLPTPPSADIDRLALTASNPGEVTLAGADGAIQAEDLVGLRVTGPVAGTQVAVSEHGSFRAVLPGEVSDTFYLEAIVLDRDVFLIAVSAPAGGGGRVEERAAGPDRDGDGSPDAVDCAPDDPAFGGQRCDSPCTPEPEICDGQDDDCDGEVDEGCTACVSDADCDDGEFCDGGESCVDGDCVAIPGIPCDDGDPSTMDICDEEADTCRYSVICSDEVCGNGLDDDCDGLVDEECDSG
jgi:hypothetical protein